MKLLTSTAFVATVLLLSSCKKQNDYTCKCEGGYIGTGVTNTIKARSVKKAEEKCASLNSGPNVDDGVFNCRLIP